MVILTSYAYQKYVDTQTTSLHQRNHLVHNKEGDIVIKFMAKIFFKYAYNYDPVELSDWTLFTIGDFVGSAFYIRPENYETQLLKDDFNVDWDTCFPGKFFRVCNSYTGNKTNGSQFFMCFDNDFSYDKSITWTCAFSSSTINLTSEFDFPNSLSWYHIYPKYSPITSHAPSDSNYAWIFSDIPYYNTVFTSFNEIVEYTRTNPALNANYSYNIYIDPNDNDYYYGYYPCMEWRGTVINPPNTVFNFANHIAPLVNSAPVQADTDPYVDGGGYSTGGDGGGGAWDDSSDVVQPSTLNLPNTTSIVKMYLLDDTTIASFASAINAQSFTNWQSYLPMFSNPLEALITLHWLPINYPSSPVVSSITIGKYDTNIVADIISNQFVEFDLGSIHVNEYWGNYLDYDGTRLQLYLPYLSCINLLPDEVMGKDLHIKYNIDMLTGVCTAIVYTYNDTIIYSGSGNMAVEIPLSAITFSNLASNFLSATTSVIVAGATMAASGGAVAGGAALASASLSGATSIMSSKPNYSKAGYVGSTAGAMSYQTPYLLISRVAQCVPQYNNEFAGYPLYVTKKIGDCSGFTQVDNIHLKNMTATDSEKTQIIELLKGGVLV